MTGFRCALQQLKVLRHNVVGIGNAENDLAFVERSSLNRRALKTPGILARLRRKPS